MAPHGVRSQAFCGVLVPRKPGVIGVANADQVSHVAVSLLSTMHEKGLPSVASG